MPDSQLIMQFLAPIVIGAPLALFVILGLTTLVGRPPSEPNVGKLVQFAVLLGLISSLGILGLMLATGDRLVPVKVGEWIDIPDYHFQIKFEFDRLSVPFVILTFLLCGTISAFANRYIHRERGFHRFFVVFALFMLGMIVTSLAGTVETLFAGWEMVGLSSALLVAFFHERPAPCRNGLHVWVIYRVSDAALLVGSILLHHWAHGGDFEVLMGGKNISWPAGQLPHDLTPDRVLIVGMLFLLAAAGKSALAPFCNWLPRAMEGPTPSSAIFYGALSVHLGAFLLLRMGPIIETSLPLQIMIVLLGLVTALYASLAGRVQTDIKCALTYASLTQVGIIVAEVGCGLRYIALIHILGHACFRTLQFLRAPSILRDVRAMEDALGRRLPGYSDLLWAKMASPGLRAWFYRLALERGYMDALLADYVVRPVLGLFQLCDSLERRWTDFLAGRQSRESDRLQSPRAMDDLS